MLYANNEFRTEYVAGDIELLTLVGFPKNCMKRIDFMLVSDLSVSFHDYAKKQNKFQPGRSLAQNH